MALPTVLVQLSDSHLRMDEPRRALQFQAAIDRVAALVPAPVAVLVTGDIADNGAPEEYAEAARLLAALDTPVHVLPGNKDDRAGLRDAFAIPGEGSGADEVRYAVDAGPLRLLICDTQVPGELRGDLDLDWLVAELDAAPDRPTVIAMHHPPADVGVPVMDAIGLPAAKRNALATALERSSQVLGVVAGHVHRATATVLGGRPVVTAPSVNFQLDADPTSTALLVNDDPPGLLLHLVTGGRLITHVQPVARL